MSDRNQQLQFLEHLATQYKFYGDTRKAFLGRFDPENADKANNQLGLSWQKTPENPEQKIQDELKKVYPALRENGCDIPETQRGKPPKGKSPWELAYKWLWQVKFPEWQQQQPKPEPTPATLNRCILGLKGNYQEAQQKLTEITQTLQTRLKDKTLSIAKVEKGSIILIVESSQTGYEQLKTLIGQKIGEFEVEYAIDEWQAICRQMLIDRKPLTSNTVLGQVYGDRNLIDDDLFVDLALVKPKRSQNEKHPQEIDPERGSDLFTRQEETIEKRFAYREFLEEVIRNRTEKQMAIIGEPGAGKTTLLQKLAFWLLQETDDLVIWVSLAELGNQPLGEYLEEKWLKEALGLSREEIKGDWEQKFKGGAVWLLLDGLDEMSQSDQQALNFRGWVMNAPIIVTCRLNLWQANPTQLQGFQTYLTQPFQDEQVQEFIQRWFPVEADAESLWSQLQAAGKERIKDLCRNPLRLTLLCATWKVENALPETTADLYAEFVETMYAWKETAFAVTEEEKERLNAGLGALAKASLEAETSRFRLTHGLVCEHLGKPKAKGSLCSLALRLGWLNEVGVAAENPRLKVYGFYHATFQEYFAALAVEDWDYFLPKDHRDRPVEGKRYWIFEPQWKQVILLWLGREDVKAEDKEGFIRALVEFKDGLTELEHHNGRGLYELQAYFLAAVGINEFKACALAAEILRQVVKWGFGYFDVEKQEWQTFLYLLQAAARKTIPETIRPLAISALIDILDHSPSEDIRRQAAESLGKIGQGNPEAIAALAKVIATTEDQWIRRQAAECLEKIGQGNPEAVAALVKIIATTENEDTRRVAAESLGKIDPGNPEAIAALVKVIAVTENDWTGRKAAESLGKIGQGNPEAIAALVKVIATTEDQWIRRQAAECLEKIGQGNPEAVAALVKIIATTENEDTRRVAAESLGKIDPGNPEAIAALVKVIAVTKNDWTGRKAAESLGKIGQGNPEAIAALVKVIATTENEDTWRVAAESLGKIDPGNPHAIDALVRIIQSNEEKFKKLHSECKYNLKRLRKIGLFSEPQVSKALNNEITRVDAARSLLKIDPGNHQAIKALFRVIQRTYDDEVGFQSAFIIREIIATDKHQQDWISPLRLYLSHENYENHFILFKYSCKLLWDIAENLPYPDFYQAWHHPTTTPHPEVTDQTPHHSETSLAPINLAQALQNQPILILNAQPLAQETREGEIALTLCGLIWKQVCPQQMYPRVSTPADLCYAIDELKFTLNLPHRALLVTDCEHPTPELITFCEKLTRVIAVAFLTKEPLEAPLKGFPPNQPNLISAIETWLEEI